jgi:hypothetical protein
MNPGNFVSITLNKKIVLIKNESTYVNNNYDRK